MIDTFKRLSDHIELDWKQRLVVILASLCLVGVCTFFVALDYQIWRLAHPDAPIISYMFR